MAQRYAGSCHCENLELVLTFDDDLVLSPRACGCSFCVAKRARWISAPSGEVVVMVKDDSKLSRYRFGTETAEFLICARCGIHVAATCDFGDSQAAVINVDVFEALRDSLAEAEPVNFSGESVDDRLARRRRTWTPMRWA